MLEIVSRILSLLVKAIPLFLSFYSGVKKEQSKEKEEVLNEVKDSKEAIDELNTNPSLAQWVRNKYTRK